MSKMRRIFSGGENGFTLIELLVVIAVLGILAAIAIPRISGVRDKADVASAKSDMRNIQTAIEMYYADTGNQPASFDDISSFIDSIDTDKYSLTTGDPYEIKSDDSFDPDGNGAAQLILTPGGFNY